MSMVLTMTRDMSRAYMTSVTRLNADLGTTILLAEHRLERAAPLADLAVRLDGGRLTGPSTVPELLASYDGAPPVTHLGHLLGWSPPPLTVRDARRAARNTELPVAHTPEPTTPGEPLVVGRGVQVRLGDHLALRGVDIEVGRGEIVALLGRNGSGKTTLLRALSGLQDVTKGAVDPIGRIAYLPQDPNALLFAPTVRAELEHTLRLLDQHDDGRVDAWLDRLGLHELAQRHPRSLSAGQRQRVAIGAVAVGGADVLLLDEPTRGIDPPSAAALERAVEEHAAEGGAVVLATHDVELAARCATRAVVLGDGEVVASGDAREVLAGSLFAPQVLRVLPPYLTVAEVAAALDR
jgi:energy-coupling factor transport system ATP-binding protein